MWEEIGTIGKRPARTLRPAGYEGEEQRGSVAPVTGRKSRTVENSVIVVLYMRQAGRDVPWAFRPIGLVLRRKVQARYWDLESS